jgi:tripartite-type tricarboxylate transporter receptor subunit TctC
MIRALLALCLLAVPAAAQDYPTKPIRLVVPYAAGGPTDVLGRILAARMGEGLGQQVLVENRAGAGGNVGSDAVAKAQPDGYTILMGTVATHALNPALYARMPYDAEKDFEPIALVAVVPLVLMVHPQQPMADLKGVIAWVKANPGKVSYGSAGNGTPIHLATELFKTTADLDMVHVPYRGSGPAMNDLVAGQIPLMFDAISTGVPHIRSGSVRAIAVTTPKRSAALPDVPTMSEAGLPGFESYTWNAFFAPAKTPRPILDRLSAEANRAVADPTTAARLADIGVDVVTGSTPASTASHVHADLAKWAPVVKASGAKID